MGTSSVEAAFYGGPRDQFEVFLLGFRGRRLCKRKDMQEEQPTQPQKQVVANVVAEAVELDLRAEYPGDPLLTDAGRVHRHTSLGGRVHDQAEQKRYEDSHCKAGMRDPAALAESWPELWSAMAVVAPVLLAARADGGALYSESSEWSHRTRIIDHLIAKTVSFNLVVQTLESDPGKLR